MSIQMVADVCVSNKPRPATVVMNNDKSEWHAQNLFHIQKPLRRTQICPLYPLAI